jgi:hypothetical protein
MIGSGFDRRDSGGDGSGQGGPSAKVRVYELAKEFSLAPKDLVAKLRILGIEVANHMSNLDASDADRFRRATERERQESLVETRLNDTVIRRRSRLPGAPPARPHLAAEPAAPVAKPSEPPVAETRVIFAVPEPTPPPVVVELSPPPAPAAAPPEPVVEVVESVAVALVVEAAPAPVVQETVEPEPVEAAAPEPAPVSPPAEKEAKPRGALAAGHQDPAAGGHWLRSHGPIHPASRYARPGRHGSQDRDQGSRRRIAAPRSQRSGFARSWRGAIGASRVGRLGSDRADRHASGSRPPARRPSRRKSRPRPSTSA